MNIRKMLFFCLMAGVMFSSCIKDEPLNAEADITGITVDGPKLIRQPVITNNEVHFYVNGWEDVTHLAPKFTLTEGATIEPASGTERDFTLPHSKVSPLGVFSVKMWKRRIYDNCQRTAC